MNPYNSLPRSIIPIHSSPLEELPNLKVHTYKKKRGRRCTRKLASERSAVANYSQKPACRPLPPTNLKNASHPTSKHCRSACVSAHDFSLSHLQAHSQNSRVNDLLPEIHQRPYMWQETLELGAAACARTGRPCA